MTPLYSIKWYRGDEEFYRFVPKEAPPTQVFPLAGISVDVSQSNAKEVHLNDVQMSLSGVYKCEVSADAPFFHTDIKSAPMIVVDFADELPLLTTEKSKYGSGERIRANCSSPPSYPAANLTWYLNGRQVPASATLVYPIAAAAALNGYREEEGRVGGSKRAEGPETDRRKPRPPGPPLERAIVGLDLDPASQHFSLGDGGPHPRHLTLRCIATLFGVYRRAVDAHLSAEDSPKIASVVLGSSRKEAKAAASSSGAHQPSLGHPGLHHNGTAGITFGLNGIALTVLANALVAANAVGLR